MRVPTDAADWRITDRRRFLKSIGALGIVGVAGCAGDGDGTASPTGTGTESGAGTDTETRTETSAQGIPSDPPTVVTFRVDPVSPGDTTTLTAELKNPYVFPILGVAVSLTPPSGDWTITAREPTELDRIGFQGTAEMTWDVTAPSNASGRTAISGSLSYETATDSTDVSLSPSVTVFDSGAVPESGLEAYYALDGDAAVNQVTGTDAVENGAPTFGAPGYIADAVSFDHTNSDGLQSGETLPLNDGAGTVGAWITISAHDSYGRLYQVGGEFSDVPSSGWQTRFDANDDAILIETRDGGNISEIATTPPLDTGTWYYVVTVVDDGEGRIHLFDRDGELSASPWTGDPTTWATSGSDPLILMTGGFDEGTSGRIDEVRAYSRALSPSEVTQLYRGSGGSA